MQVLVLFWEFFRIGLFSIGGGLATLPFLYDLADRYDWLRLEQIPDMIAISESTPGPMGINMATYAGFQCAGPLGSVIATVGLVTPSVIVIIIVYQFLEKFRTSTTVENAFYGLRPIVVGLIASAGFGVIVMSLFQTEGWQMGMSLASLIHWKECILFVLIFVAAKKWKNLHPIALILAGAVVGIVFHLG